MGEKEQIAEFIGIMLGDGNFRIYNTKAGNKIKKQHRIKVTLDSRNKEYIVHVCNLFKIVLDIEPRLYYHKNENAVDIATYKKNKFYYVLNEIGLRVSPKWNNMKIPKGYDAGKLGLLVLKGVFDTDGHLSIFNNNGIKYPRIEIRLCPSPAQKQIDKILDEFDFKYKVQNLERRQTRIRISGKEQLKKWFDLIGSANPIHIEKAKFLL